MASSSAPETKTDTATLASGATIPLLGLGTWRSAKGAVKAAVLEAIKIGYRHIDCAYVYGNEGEIGEALAEAFSTGLVKREDMFITSKLWSTRFRPELVAPALKQTLKDLQLDYVDLYLAHWPVALVKNGDDPSVEMKSRDIDRVPFQSTWKALEAVHKEGLAKHIGVSNFGVQLINDVLSYATVKPAVNQVECHPYLPQHDIIKFCKENNIHVTAYAPIGRPGRDLPNTPYNDDVIVKIAKKHDCSPAQVMLKWNTQRGVSAVPKSTNPQRLKQNFASLELVLADDEIKSIDALHDDPAKRCRLVSSLFEWSIF